MGSFLIIVKKYDNIKLLNHYGGIMKNYKLMLVSLLCVGAFTSCNKPEDNLKRDISTTIYLAGDSTVKTYEDNLLVGYEDTSYTHGEGAFIVNEVANKLQSIGIEKQDFVGLFVDLKAGEEVRFIEKYDEQFIDREITVNCKELLEDVKSFNCGIYNAEEDNIGATITVELRLYETMDPAETEHNTTNIETGRWVTVATVPCTIMAA